MALDEGERPAVLGGLVDVEAQHGRLADVEGRAAGLGGEPLQLRPHLFLVEPAQVVVPDLDLGVGVHELQRLGEGGEVEAGTKDLVPPGELRGRRAQRRQRERRVVDEREERDVVVGALVPVGEHLVDHRGLHHRERVGVHQAGGQGRAVGGRQQRERRHPLLLDARRPAGRGRPGEACQALDALVHQQVLHGQVDPAPAQRADHLDRADRVAAQLEEVVEGADLRQSEHLRPGLGDDLLAPGPGVDVLARSPDAVRVGVGQRPAVDLAVGGHREGVQRDEDGGHHVAGQRPAEPGPQLRRLDRAAGPRDDVRDQPGLALARSAVRDHQAAVHLGQAGEGRLDLAGLDPVAADLHLFVGPAEELQVAVGAVARQVAGAVHPGPRLGGERVGQEPFGGQARTAQVSARQAGSGDVELARDADRHPVEVGVQQVQPQVAERAADRAAPGAGLLAGPDRAVGDVHGGLGDAVHVDQ
nr:hypothetical protein [Streptomyces sp. e14]